MTRSIHNDRAARPSLLKRVAGLVAKHSRHVSCAGFRLFPRESEVFYWTENPASRRRSEVFGESSVAGFRLVLSPRRRPENHIAPRVGVDGPLKRGRQRRGGG